MGVRLPDKAVMQADFRDAALFWGWSEADKREVGAAIAVALAAADKTDAALWAAQLAEDAEAWRRLRGMASGINERLRAEGRPA